MIKNKCLVLFFFISTTVFGVEQSTVVQPLVPNANEFQLVFQDEFNAKALDWNVWGSLDAAHKTSGGLKVGRWKENAVLADGLLKLMVKKGNRPDSDWTAAYIWIKKTYGANTYYETRFKVTNAPGINNAFWTSCIGALDKSTRSYKNRYEIDVVEAKKYNTGDSINGHLAWHDWKTFSYAKKDIAQGMVLNYKTTDFLTWGLWVGEDHFIIYCNGIEQSRGITHKKYINQWNTGVGKLTEWPTQEEKRAYGKWGQDDWSYLGGMNGDDMNICLSTQPWSDSKSTLTDAGDNSSMDVDYLRIYKLKTNLLTVPSQVEKTIALKKRVTINKPIDLNSDKNFYFSFVVNRTVASNAVCLLKLDAKTQLSFTMTKDNNLSIKVEGTEASTDRAYPANLIQSSIWAAAQKQLIVCRVTASSVKKDIISFSRFQLNQSIPEKEPFLYRNIDDAGNTSITNEWSINKKLITVNQINGVEFTDEANQCEFSDLTFGESYLSVVAKYLDVKSISGIHK